MPIAHDQEYQAHLGPARFTTGSEPVPGFGLWFTIGKFGSAIFSASDTGLVAYSLLEPPQYQFTWMTRTGTPVGDVGSPAAFSTFDLSSDGRRLVVSRPRVDRVNLWAFDFDRNSAFSQITFEPTLEFDPRWGPDRKTVVTTASVKGKAGFTVVTIAPDGSRTDVLRKSFVDDWSRDGRFLLVRPADDAGKLYAQPLFGDRTPILVRNAPGAAD